MPFRLTPQQRAFFDAFGFLRLEGLFSPDAERLSRAFDASFAAGRAAARAEQAELTLDDGDQMVEAASLTAAIGRAPVLDTYHRLNFDRHRALLAGVVESTPGLSWLVDDPRIEAVVRGLIGTDAEYVGSDGHRFDCDTAWHWDAYGSPIEVFHVKLLFYLDPLDGDSGALRVLPGTSHHEDAYPSGLRPLLFDPDGPATRLGVAPEELPSLTVASEPGDVVAVNFRTVHASFHGRADRRLFTLNFRERPAPAAR